MPDTQHAFFDANVYLSLYKLPPADLRELKKVVDLVNARRLEIFVTSQVVDEVRRSRARVIATELKAMREGWPRIALPSMAQDGERFDAWKAAQSSAAKAFRAVLDELETAAREQTLRADLLVARFLRLGGPTYNCSDLLVPARDRRALGNPPGKSDSLGDAVSWEALLRFLPYGADLDLVTSDRDFTSPLDPTSLNEFLLAEWERKKGSTVHVHANLAEFLEARFPEVRLIPDLRKHIRMEEFLQSPSFNDTHLLLARLRRYREFTPGEAERLLIGGLENTQIFWLADDPDVAAFVQDLLEAHRTHLPQLLCAKWDLLQSGSGRNWRDAPTDEEARKWVDGQYSEAT